jgi:hypothetical protein
MPVYVFGRCELDTQLYELRCAGVPIRLGPKVGCRTSLSCISKWFGGFCSRLLRLRTGKLSSAFRLHGFAHIF